MRKGRKIRPLLWHKYLDCIDNYAPALVNKRGEIVAYMVRDHKTRERKLIRIKHD